MTSWSEVDLFSKQPQGNSEFEQIEEFSGMSVRVVEEEKRRNRFGGGGVVEEE